MRGGPKAVMVCHGEHQGAFYLFTRSQGELKEKSGGGAGTSAESVRPSP